MTSISDSDEDDYLVLKKRARMAKSSCPYLRTINRFALDFDFDKVCSVTLSNTNVYACLVCGRYFQGRGKETPALIHSMEHGHHLFINLQDAKTWCLPDNYEVAGDDSLEDIVFNLDPKIFPQDLKKLPESAVSLTGSEYHPGLIGLNQTKDASYLNAALHALCTVVPVRDSFVLMNHPTDNKLSRSLSDLFKKICNWRSFKGVTSPHEFLQQVSVKSKGEYFASHADPAKFLNWLLMELKHTAISNTFRGESPFAGPFFVLSLDLPPMPVFKELATVMLSDLLVNQVQQFPEYLIIHFRRFVKNNFFLEKNSTLVRFPMKGLSWDGCGDVQYSLVAVVSHEGKPEGGLFKTCALHPVSNQWFECEALRVRKILPESVPLYESYIHIWRRSSTTLESH